MKKTSIFLSLMAAGVMTVAQTARMSLYEEFTGENCPPCASTNPGLDALLKSGTNPTKIIPLKWQVPIPSAPTATWSLYKTNKAEIDWRYTAGGYGYAISSAPSSRIDGQNATVFGAASDHPANLNNTVINTASSYTTPFSVSLARQWDATYSSITVTVNVQATSAFTAVGNLMFRLCMVEKEIHFATAPGTNGEKDFNWVVRKSFPTATSGTVVTGMGTAMPGTWTMGQTQTFTINCPLPAYIVDKSQVNFVGFLQDDGNKKVWQAAETMTVGLPNDAKANAVALNDLACSNTITPMVTIFNNGTNAITDFTVTPKLDATTGAPVFWTGNLAAGASTTIPLNTINPTAGNHVYSYTITNVSGGDYAMANNSASKSFIVSPNTFMPPVQQTFSATAAIPTNWSLYNPDAGANTWSRQGTANAYVATPAGAMRYYFWNNSVSGDIDDLYLPPTDLTGVSSPVLSFDHAYRQYSSSYIDQLDVQVSTNCGTSWTTVFTKAGSQLATVPSGTASYVPAVTDWTNTAIALPAAANQPQVLVRFRAINDYGNNLWLDNVNLGGPLSVIKNMPENVSFDVYPNPSKGETNIKISSATSAPATITVLNTLGQTVYSKQTTLEFGINTIQLDTKDFADGVYNVIVTSDSNSSVKKLTVTK